MFVFCIIVFCIFLNVNYAVAMYVNYMLHYNANADKAAAVIRTVLTPAVVPDETSPVESVESDESDDGAGVFTGSSSFAQIDSPPLQHLPSTMNLFKRFA